MRRKMQNGDSLVEWLIQLGIVGLLALIAVPAYHDYVSRERFTKAISVVDQIENSVNRYILEHEGTIDLKVPDNWSALGLSGLPVLPQEISGISLSSSGEITVDVAPGVAGSDSCQISYTRGKAGWSAVTNCPEPVSTVIKRCKANRTC